MTIEEIIPIISKEYEHLCKAFALNPLNIDVYMYDSSKIDSKTDFGTSKGNATPGYSQTLIVLPQDEYNLSKYNIKYDSKLNFPPKMWNVTMMENEWPHWRIDLWHEFCHQIQHEIIGIWNPNDGKEGHAEGWYEAKSEMARKFNQPVENIEAIL